jgi:hypothetical protein
MGHNLRRHNPERMSIVGHAVRHVVSLVRNGCTISTFELCQQAKAVLATLVGMCDVVLRRRDPLNVLSLRQIKYVYDLFLNWVQHPDNPHRVRVQLVPSRKITADMRIVVGADPQQQGVCRPTHARLKAMLRTVCAGAVQLPGIEPAEDVGPERMCVRPFEDVVGGRIPLEEEVEEDSSSSGGSSSDDDDDDEMEVEEDGVDDVDVEGARQRMSEWLQAVFGAADKRALKLVEQVSQGHRFRCGDDASGLQQDNRVAAKRRRREIQADGLLPCCGAPRGCDFVGDYPVVQVKWEVGLAPLLKTPHPVIDSESRV